MSEEREAVGSKELTGFAENNCPLLEPADKDSQRYSTHYQSKYVKYWVYVHTLANYQKLALSGYMDVVKPLSLCILAICKFIEIIFVERLFLLGDAH